MVGRWRSLVRLHTHARCRVVLGLVGSPCGILARRLAVLANENFDHYALLHTPPPREEEGLEDGGGATERLEEDGVGIAKLSKSKPCK